MALQNRVKIGDRYTVRLGGGIRLVEVIERVEKIESSSRFRYGRKVVTWELRYMQTGKVYQGRRRTAAFLRTWKSGIGWCHDCDSRDVRVYATKDRAAALCSDCKRTHMNSTADPNSGDAQPDSREEPDVKKTELTSAIMAINPEAELPKGKANTKAALEKILTDLQAKAATDVVEARLAELKAMKKGDLVKLAGPLLAGEKIKDVRKRTPDELIAVIVAGTAEGTPDAPAAEAPTPVQCKGKDCNAVLSTPDDIVAGECDACAWGDTPEALAKHDAESKAAAAKAKTDKAAAPAASAAPAAPKATVKKASGKGRGGNWDTRNHSAQKNIERWTRRVSEADAKHLAHAYALIGEGKRAEGRAYLLKQKMVPAGTTTKEAATDAA